MCSDDQALAEMRHQLRRFLAFSEAAARNAGVEPGQHQLLLALVGLPDGVSPTIGALAERLVIRHHSAVELVDRLVDARLVKRSRSERDRREVLLTVTRKGARLLARLSASHVAELRTNGPALVKALQSIVGRVERRKVSSCPTPRRSGRASPTTSATSPRPPGSSPRRSSASRSER